jgi:hypothetical protein
MPPVFEEDGTVSYCSWEIEIKLLKIKLQKISDHIEKMPDHKCKDVPCWHCELKNINANFKLRG